MRKKPFLTLLILFLLVIVGATELNEFSNEETSENLSFAYGGENLTRFFKLFNNSNVSLATIDLKSFNKSWCYQESANVSTSCGGLSTGEYSVQGGWATENNLWDGDWSTDSSRTNVPNLTIVYDKPSLASGGVWQVGAGFQSLNRTNNTVTSTCWDANPTNITVKIISVSGVNAFYVKCWDGSDYVTLNEYIYPNANRFYEEAMWWDIGKFPQNISIDTFNDSVVDYQNDSVWNGSKTVIEDDSEDSWNSSGTLTDPENATDEDWSTKTVGSSTPPADYIFENFTIPSWAEGADFMFKADCFYGSIYDFVTFWNYNNDSWDVLTQDCNDEQNNTVGVPKEALTSPLQLRVYVVATALGDKFEYFEGMVKWYNTSIEYDVDLNLSVINSSLGSCDCDGCSLNTSTTFPLCTFPVRFESDSAGTLQVSDINITYHVEPANITQGGILNYTQTVNLSQTYSFDLLVSHDYTPNISQTATYNISALGNNSNSTHSFEFEQLLVGPESSNTTEINITISGSASLTNYSFNITIIEEDGKSTSYFPVYLVIGNETALIDFNDTSDWVSTNDDNDVFSVEYIISNTGNYDATSCSASATGILNNYLSVSESSFNISSGSTKEVTFTFSSVAPASYDSHYLHLECLGTPDEDTVFSSYIKLDFSISRAGESGGSSAGGSPPSELVCEELDWSMRTETGTTGYSLLLPKESNRSRCKSLIFENHGSEKVVVSLSIPDSSLKQFIELENSSVVLEPNEFLEQEVEFCIIIPPNSSYDDVYTFQVFATDNSRCEGTLSVEAKVSYWGNIFRYNSLGDFSYPVVLPSLLFSILIFVGVVALFRRLPVISIVLGSTGSLLVFVIGVIIF